jgi:hypothetical protein
MQSSIGVVTCACDSNVLRLLELLMLLPVYYDCLRLHDS